MNLKKISIHLFLASLLAFCFFVGCGGEHGSSTGSSSGNDVNLDGSVSTSSSTSKSVSIGPSEVEIGLEEEADGLSLAKSGSVGKADASDGVGSEESTQVIVSKAFADTTCSSGTCTVQKLDGTVLDTCQISGGAFSGCNIKAEDVGSSNMIEIICNACGTKVSKIIDCSDCKNGEAKSTGDTNTTTTLAATLLYSGADSKAHPENITGSFKSALNLGDVNLESFKTIEKQLGLSGSANAADARGALISMKKCIAAGMADGKFTSISDVSNVLQGGSKLAQCQGLDGDLNGVNLTNAADIALQSPASVINYFKDSGVRAKWGSDAAQEALAKSLAAYSKDALLSVVNFPANARNMFDKYAEDFNKGVSAAAAFAKMTETGAGAAFGEYMKGWATNMTGAEAGAARALFNQMSFSNPTQSKDLGKSIFSQIRACDTAAELANVTGNPFQYANTIMSKPSALAEGGAAVAQQWYNQMATGGTLAGFTPCGINADCLAGQTCSTVSKFCSASAAGLGNSSGIVGAACTNNNDCASNSCVSSFCTFGTGDLTNKKLYGQACAVNADCVNELVCSGGTCGF